MKDSKKIRLTIGSIIKKMERHTLNFNHPLQRAAEQHTNIIIGNLISDILQENPIPDLVFAEQIIHEAPVTWVIDGKQRCTNIQAFVNNKIRISEKITRSIIKYPVPVLGENGEPIRDEEGIIIHEVKEFDIRKKRFKDLPKELQERFLDYGFDIVLYLDCSEENIAYHIKRYNEGKPMNPAQKGLTRLGVHFANMVNNISAMSFFEDAIGDYSVSQFKNGTIDRIIVESIVTTRFLNNWTKDYADMCEFIKNNAHDEDFENFESLVGRLESVVDDTTGKMFDAKNSLLWFGLFSEFTKLGLSDNRFNDFMYELNKGLCVTGEDEKQMSGICVVEIDGVTYEELLKNKSTKDKSVVQERIEFLVKLMCEYFGVEYDKTAESTVRLQQFYNDFQGVKLPYCDKNTALKSLLFFTEYPVNNYTDDNLYSFEKWLEHNESILNEYDDCLLWAEVLAEKFANLSINDKFSANDIPILIQIMSEIDDEYDDRQLNDWLSEINNERKIEISGESSGIIDKHSYFITSLKEYTKE